MKHLSAGGCTLSGTNQTSRFYFNKWRSKTRTDFSETPFTVSPHWSETALTPDQSEEENLELNGYRYKTGLVLLVVCIFRLCVSCVVYPDVYFTQNMGDVRCVEKVQTGRLDGSPVCVLSQRIVFTISANNKYCIYYDIIIYILYVIKYYPIENTQLSCWFLFKSPCWRFRCSRTTRFLRSTIKLGGLHPEIMPESLSKMEILSLWANFSFQVCFSFSVYHHFCEWSNWKVPQQKPPYWCQVCKQAVSV